MMKDNEKQHLLGVTLEEFTDWCKNNNLPHYRAKQVFEWVYEKGVTDFWEMSNLPKNLRQALPEHWFIRTGEERRRLESPDGTTKLLLEWPDQATSECVLIPEGKRHTACISSQVGCPVSCAFCASGRGGLERQLTPGQIVEQAFAVHQLATASGDDRDRGLTNIVIMGLGEPLANYKSVLSAIRIINADWGLNVGARKITVSTVGLPGKIRKLAHEDLQINLAISLHAPEDKLRRKLIPWAKKHTIEDVVDAARYYFDTTGREVTIEYLLIAGVNDSVELARRLVTLARRMRANVNIIRYNPVPGLSYQRPKSSDTHRFAEEMRARGIKVHIRKSRGLDIDAACGQLRRASSGNQKIPHS
jgi:23S rRNA (adenine2503-C2)-methyltransferase